MILRLLLTLPLLIQSALCVNSAKIQSINVNCEEDGMGVDIQFDQAFHGVIFSKNFFSSPGCNYINNPGQDKVHFTIKAGQCGTVMGPPANGAALAAKRTRRDANHTLLQIGNHTFNVSDLRQGRSDMFGMDFGKMDGMFGGGFGASSNGGSNTGGYENSREDMPPPEAMEFMQQPNQQQTPGQQLPQQNVPQLGNGQQLPQQNVPQLGNGPDQSAHLAGHEVASLGQLPQPQFQGQVPMSNMPLPDPSIPTPNAPRVGQYPAAEGDRIQQMLTAQANSAQQPLLSAVGNVNGLYNNYPVQYNTPPKVMSFGGAPNPPPPPNPMGSYNLQQGLQVQLPPGANQVGSQYNQGYQPNYQQSPYANVGYGNQYANNAGTPSGAYQVPSNNLDSDTKYDDDASTTTGAPEDAYAFPTGSPASDAERLTGRSGNYDNQGQVYNVPGFNADASSQYGSPVPNAQYLGGGSQAMGRQYDASQMMMQQAPPQVPQMPSYPNAMPQGMMPPGNPGVPDYPAPQQGPPMYPSGPDPMNAPYSPGVPAYQGGQEVPSVPQMQAPDMGNLGGGGMPQMPQVPPVPQMNPYGGMQQGDYGMQNGRYNNNMGGYNGNSNMGNNMGNMGNNGGNAGNSNMGAQRVNNGGNNNLNIASNLNNAGNNNQVQQTIAQVPVTARSTTRSVVKTKDQEAESADYDESDENSLMVSSTTRGAPKVTTGATIRRQAATTLSDDEDDDGSLQVLSSTARVPVTAAKAKTTTASADDSDDEDDSSSGSGKSSSSSGSSSSGSISSSNSGSALSRPSISQETNAAVKSHPLPDQLPRLRAILRDTKKDKKFSDSDVSGGGSSSSSSSGNSGFAGDSASAGDLNASVKQKPTQSNGGDGYDTRYDNHGSEPAFGYNEPKNQYDSRYENIGGDKSAGGREPAFGYHEPSGPGEPKFQYNEPADQYREPGFGYKEPVGQFSQEPAFGYREPSGPGEPKFQYNEPAGRFNQEPAFGYNEPGDRYDSARDNGGSEPSFGYHEPSFGYKEPGFGYREPTGGAMPENGGAYDKDLSAGPGAGGMGGGGGGGGFGGVGQGSYSPGVPTRGGGSYGGGQAAQGGYNGGNSQGGAYAGGNAGQGISSNGNSQTGGGSANNNGQNAGSSSNRGVLISGGASAGSASNSGSGSDSGIVVNRNNQVVDNNASQVAGSTSGSSSSGKFVSSGGNAISLPGKSTSADESDESPDDSSSSSGSSSLGSGLAATTKKWGKGWGHKSKSGSSDEDDSYGDDSFVTAPTQKPVVKAKAQDFSGGNGQQMSVKAGGLNAQVSGSASSSSGSGGAQKPAISIPSRGSSGQGTGGLTDFDNSDSSSFKQSGQSSSQSGGQFSNSQGSASNGKKNQAATQSGTGGSQNVQAVSGKSNQNQQAADEDSNDQDNKVISGVKKSPAKADSSASADSASNRGSVDTSDGGYIENVIIIQNDPLVQEVWDAARAIRCEWRSNYKKTVSTKERIALTEVQTMRFAGDDIEVWMEIQAGKGPWADPVSNIVPIGHTMTLLIGANDPKHEFDLRVGKCVAHDGGKSQIELTDDNGCVVRDRIMGKFDKAKDWGAEHATIAFAHFSAFKFPETTKVFIECDVEVCKKGCADMCSTKAAAAKDTAKGKMVSVNSQGSSSSGAVDSKATGSRQKRNVKTDKDTLSVKTHYDAVSPADLSFNVDINLPAQNGTIITYAGIRQNTDQYCMSRGGFGVGLGILLTAVLVASLSSVFLCLRYKNQRPLFLN